MAVPVGSEALAGQERPARGTWAGVTSLKGSVSQWRCRHRAGLHGQTLDRGGQSRGACRLAHRRRHRYFSLRMGSVGQKTPQSNGYES